MPANDSLRQTLEHYRAQEKQLLSELQGLRLMISRLERDLGESPSNSEITINVADSLPAMVERVEVTNGRKPEIRPDEFFGMTQAEAARKYLKRIGHAVSFEDLVTALQSGGCKVGGENPKRILYISLVRNTRDFVPPQVGYIGLREFYPSGAGGRPPKEREPKRRKTGKKLGRASSKGRGKLAKAKVQSNEKKSPSPVSGAVRSVLADKQARSADEIVAAVAAKIGSPVKKIAVTGTLNNKKIFEKVDGKYKLIK